MKQSYYRVTVHVPEANADAVREAIGKVGGGKIGNYGFCSFSTKGMGRFLPQEGAHPAIGDVGKLEEVVEESIEFRCEESLLTSVIEAIKKAHPYEEPGIEIIQLINI